MTEPGEPTEPGAPGERRTRRRRRRATSPGGPPPERGTSPVGPLPEQASAATGAQVPEASAPVAPPARRGARRPRAEAGDRDRGLRSLVGAGPSQLGVGGALRGRDVNRPSEDDLAEAERDVVIVRRHWAPRE